MLGLPIEIITMLGSSLFSSVMTMMSSGRKHQYELMKHALTQNKQDNVHQLQQIKADKTFTFTRRIIALTVVVVTSLILMAPAVFDVPTVVELVNETSGLFGLFSDKTITYEMIKGFVLPDWWSTAFTSIIGLYFGHSMVK